MWPYWARGARRAAGAAGGAAAPAAAGRARVPAAAAAASPAGGAGPGAAGETGSYWARKLRPPPGDHFRDQTGKGHQEHKILALQDTMFNHLLENTLVVSDS